MTEFEGVVAVTHAPAVDGRRIGEPGPQLTRPLPLPLTSQNHEIAGRIERVWLEGDLVCVEGTMLSETACSFVHEKGWIAHLEADSGQFGQYEEGELTGWRMMGAMLGPADSAAWPQMSLRLVEDNTP